MDPERVIKQEPNDETNFMDLSAIGCSLLMDHMEKTNITVTGCEQPVNGTTSCSGNYASSYLSPAGYPGGLTPYQTPYVTPYCTPFQTPSHSPISSLHSSPAASMTTRLSKPGIDEELALILDNDPFLWDHLVAEQPKSKATTPRDPPPPYPKAAQSRTLLKQQLQREQVEQQEKREKELSKQLACPREPSGIAITKGARIDPGVVSVPVQVLRVCTRLENPTAYHVNESRKRQVREFLQQEQQCQSVSPASSHLEPPRQVFATGSAPPGGLFTGSRESCRRDAQQVEVTLLFPH